MKVLGVAELTLLLIYLLRQHKKYGYFVFLNIRKLAFSFWLGAFGLYNLGISSLLQPDIPINILGFLIIGNFAVMAGMKTKTESRMEAVAEGVAGESFPGRYIKCVYFLLAGGILSFVLSFVNYGFTLFHQNKINRTELVLPYLYNSIVVCSIFLYYLFRTNGTFLRKGCRLLVFAISVFMLLCMLNRGNIIFIFTAVLILELFLYFSRTKKKYISLKGVVLVSAFLASAVFMFGVVGDMRFETVSREVYHMRYVELYGLSPEFPFGLGQLYMYLVSPLENMSHVLMEQEVTHYTFFCNLFYPGIKLIANLIGKGGVFSEWLSGQYEIYPYLQPRAGLNVMSFMADAYQDLGIAGIVVYLAFYDFILVAADKVLHSKMYGISKTIIYSFMIQIVLWGIFTNSVFRMGNLWVNIFFVFVMDTFVRCVHFSGKKIGGPKNAAGENSGHTGQP